MNITLTSLLYNIGCRRQWFLTKYGSEEAAGSYIADDNVLKSYYEQADKLAVQVQPKPSPAFKTIPTLRDLSPVLSPV